MLARFRQFIAAGYVFIPANPKGERKEESIALRLSIGKGLSIEALATSKINFGAAITTDLGKRFHAGPAVIVDPNTEKKTIGFLITWGLKR